MSSFTSPLVVSPMPNGKDWKLDRPFTYRIHSRYSKRLISVPRGFVSDFASIPKFIFWLLPWWAKFSKAPILHDFLYKEKYLTRKESDDIFLEAMLIEWRNRKSRHLVAWIEYYAVRIFGGLVW